ncbi:MAG: hypothetical protein KG003_04505 [Bacteroidetes bacterium]|nr:hypothetical protein [Bacteroidota bacterium]
MITQAYFENIQKHILDELQLAQSSIHLALAWFTDSVLFETLLDKAKQNVRISLIALNDEINARANGIDYSVLKKKGGEVLLVERTNESLMHNKFCVIDNDTVITGSYNWTVKAKRNDENITIVKDNPQLASDFILAFGNIREKYGAPIPEIDMHSFCKRLEILRNCILLQDRDDIAYQTSKFEKIFLQSNNSTKYSETEAIIAHLQEHRFSSALEIITHFLEQYSQVQVWLNPEIDSLHFECRSLEIQITSLEDEKNELEKMIREFERRHNKELGNLILEILELRKARAEKEAKENPTDEKRRHVYEETQQDYNTFKGSYEEIKSTTVRDLTTEQQQELKTKYRKATKLCHPDTVSAMQATESAQVFDQLTKAYDDNDVETVSRILEYLETGKPFKAKHETFTENDKLKVEVTRLQLTLQRLIQAINEIKQSETYQKISVLGDWNVYFQKVKKQLEIELLNMQKQNVRHKK